MIPVEQMTDCELQDARSKLHLCIVGSCEWRSVLARIEAIEREQERRKQAANDRSIYVGANL